ncbi:MAG: Ldh family oxidoreductase [Saprospiraceae bacterium]|nr:Ldh family oxidoreductase [Saprospiraceae bacterium]
MLPVGGLTLGFKGFGYGLLMEALTSGLGGAGRRNPAGRWSASVFLQLIDPDKFGGKASFLSEMQHLVDNCHASKVHPNFVSVRLPGERALALKRQQLKDGILLHPEVVKGLEKCGFENS